MVNIDTKKKLGKLYQSAQKGAIAIALVFASVTLTGVTALDIQPEVVSNADETKSIVETATEITQPTTAFTTAVTTVRPTETTTEVAEATKVTQPVKTTEKPTTTARVKLTEAVKAVKAVKKGYKEESGGATYAVPNDESGCRSQFKSYMSYKAITNTSSAQYKLVRGDDAHTNEENGIRMIGDRYCVAVGSYYTSKIGTKLNLNMESGVVIPCILADAKSNYHTDSSNRYHTGDGSIAEFIVDYSVFNDVQDGSGTVNFAKGFAGKIKSITVF